MVASLLLLLTSFDSMYAWSLILSTSVLRFEAILDMLAGALDERALFVFGESIILASSK